MKYQIGNFTLDVKARTLCNKTSCQNIRPKTLALLLYLVQRPEQIISKQELLDNVWDDVAVDEGVIFQSVREIRGVFADSQVIQNHPRKGYQLTVQVLDLSAPASWVSKGKIAALGLLLLVFTVTAVWNLTIPSKKAPSQQSVLVLPVKSHIPYGENDWLALGGMEQVITQLNSVPEHTYIYQASHVLELMNQLGLSNELKPQEAKVVLNNSGASMVVETEIHGNVYDYKLVYKLHREVGVQQGVILDTSIPSALTKLTELIKNKSKASNSTTEFSKTLLSEAMISYESDWQTSISFFESYLTLNPDSIVAVIYLSKLYLWQGEVEKASSLMGEFDTLPSATIQQLAQINLLRARIAMREKDWSNAFKWFEVAQSYHQAHNDWFLKANIEEEIGLAMLEQCKFAEAIDALTLANTYYRLINSPIGINSSLLHKSYAQFLMGDRELSALTFNSAKENIKETELVFLQTMLVKYQNAMSQASLSDC